ncbi:MAG: hypothetical protein [Arizlama microvirus]|nr:MAG: hypothetical protein [Arizlama microvirus]
MAKKSTEIIVPKHNPRRSQHMRSILDLGDFSDNECNFGPSLTDETQDIPIHEIVAKLCRGENVGAVTPVYDAPSGSNITDEQLMAGQSATERPGFDLADVPQILAVGEAAVASLQTPPTPPVASPAEPPPTPPAVEPPPPAGA